MNANKRSTGTGPRKITSQSRVNLAPIEERVGVDRSNRALLMKDSSEVQFGASGARDSLINLSKKDSSAVNWFEIRPTGHVPERRAYHSTCVIENHLYIYGGQDINVGTLDNMWMIPLEFLETNNDMKGVTNL
jgi:hypothetical protein